MAKHYPDKERRQKANLWCALVTPVLKASWTDQAFHGASDCLQVFGGHGYVRERGIEQVVRDARVTIIYEGANEIQAIDLLVCKVLTDAGAGLSSLLLALCEGLDQGAATHAQFMRQVADLRQLTGELVDAAKLDQELAYWAADDYLRSVALTLLAWAWLQISEARSQATTSTEPARWTAPASAMRHWVLPEFGMRIRIMKARLEEMGMLPEHIRLDTVF